MALSSQVESLKFKWGVKRGTCEENKDVQFYESFMYDGSEYCLYDCVSVSTPGKPSYVGKITKMWEHNDHRENPRRIELLWFFKPSEISRYLGGVQDVLSNELFLASGTGSGLVNDNPVEVISGKCYVLCISKDVRNPQPSDEEIKSADFLFYRTFDVGTRTFSDTIDDKIAGVDVTFIFNRTSCAKKASAVPKVANGVHRTADSLNPNLPSTSGSVRQYKHNASDLSGHMTSDYAYKKEKDNKCHKQLARNKSTISEERGNKDSGRHDGELDCCNATGSRKIDFHESKNQKNEVIKQLTNQKPRPAEERCSKSAYSLDDLPQKKRKIDGYVVVSDDRTKMSQKMNDDGRKDTIVVKPRLAEERCSKDSYCLDDMLQKKRTLDDSVAVSDQRTKTLQNMSHGSSKNVELIRNPRDEVTRGKMLYSERPSFSDKKQDLRITKYSEGKETKLATEKGLIKKPTFDCEISKHTKGKILTDANYRRDYRVFEVTPKPDARENKWYRNLSWEENLKCAEGQGNLVLLHNLDPTYTSDEVENIVYSALNEQCTARMIERTSYNISHMGEALVIFKTMDAAKRAIRRLEEGCLLLPNGRTLVATNAKVNPTAKPPLRFTGHIKPRAQKRREMKDAVATSHASQRNTIEYDMSLEWCLHQSINELTWKKIFERQIEEMKKLQLKKKPKVA